MVAKCPDKIRWVTLCLSGYVAAGSRHGVVNNQRAHGVAEPRRAAHCLLPPVHCFEFPGFRVRVLLKGVPTQGGTIAGESPTPVLRLGPSARWRPVDAKATFHSESQTRRKNSMGADLVASCRL
jgi:hypothetical protein